MHCPRGPVSYGFTYGILIHVRTAFGFVFFLLSCISLGTTASFAVAYRIGCRAATLYAPPIWYKHVPPISQVLLKHPCLRAGFISGSLKLAFSVHGARLPIGDDAVAWRKLHALPKPVVPALRPSCVLGGVV